MKRISAGFLISILVGMLLSCKASGPVPAGLPSTESASTPGYEVQGMTPTISQGQPSETQALINIQTQDWLNQVSFSADGALVGLSFKQKIEIYSVEPLKLVCTINALFLSDSLFSFSPDGQLIAFTIKDTPGISIYDTKTCGLVRTLKADDGNFRYVFFSVDGQKIYALPGSYGIYTVDANSGEIINKTLAETRDDKPSFSSDGKYGWVNMGIFMVAGSGEYVGFMENQPFYSGPTPQRIIFLPNGMYVQIMDPSSWKDPMTLHQSPDVFLKVDITLTGSGNPHFALSADGKKLAGMQDYSISIIDVVTGRTIKTMQEEKSPQQELPTVYKDIVYTPGGDLYGAVLEQDNSNMNKFYVKKMPDIP